MEGLIFMINKIYCPEYDAEGGDLMLNLKEIKLGFDLQAVWQVINFCFNIFEERIW